MVLDPIKQALRVFLNSFKNLPEKACVHRVHNNYAFVSIQEKHRILMSVLSVDKTLHTNKEKVYGYKVTARDVLSTI